MAKIPITRMEFEKGWSRALAVYSSAPRPNNAHRLLLFYAVENGLKAVIMKSERLADGAASFDEEVHDINKLLVRANATASLRLPETVKIRDKVDNSDRNCATSQINQMWRYGCIAQSPSDADLEAKLHTVATWIGENL